MKKILTLLLLVPVLLHAQSDEKYMAGAVPEIDGKVVFTRELDVKEFSKEQIYTALLGWASDQSNNKLNVVFKDEPDGSLAALGNDIFRVRIGLFPSNVKMQYTLVAKCSDGNCTLETSKIKYTNNPASKLSTDVIRAEEYIIDKYALNKTKTKIFKGTGDYRKETIKIVDSVTKAAEAFVYSYYNTSAPAATVIQRPAAVQAQPAAQPTAQEPVQQVAQTVQPAEQQTVRSESQSSVIAMDNLGNTANMKAISASDIPAELVKAIKESGIYIIAVDGRPLANAVLGSGDLDATSDKPAVVFSVTENTDNILYLLEKADTYSLVVVGKEASNEPLLTIQCKKSQQFGKMFVGEIVEVKMK